MVFLQPTIFMPSQTSGSIFLLSLYFSSYGHEIPGMFAPKLPSLNRYGLTKVVYAPTGFCPV
jgi:hypothetical protein